MLLFLPLGVLFTKKRAIFAEILINETDEKTLDNGLLPSDSTDG